MLLILKIIVILSAQWFNIVYYTVLRSFFFILENCLSLFSHFFFLSSGESFSTLYKWSKKLKVPQSICGWFGVGNINCLFSKVEYCFPEYCWIISFFVIRCNNVLLVRSSAFMIAFSCLLF